MPQGCDRRWGGCGLQGYSASVSRVLAGHGERMLTYGQLPGEADESCSVTISSPSARNRGLTRHADGQQLPPCRLQEKRMGQEDEHTRDGKWLRQKAAQDRRRQKNSIYNRRQTAPLGTLSTCVSICPWSGSHFFPGPAKRNSELCLSALFVCETVRWVTWLLCAHKYG